MWGWFARADTEQGWPRGLFAAEGQVAERPSPLPDRKVGRPRRDRAEIKRRRRAGRR